MGVRGITGLQNGEAARKSPSEGRKFAIDKSDAIVHLDNYVGGDRRTYWARHGLTLTYLATLGRACSRSGLAPFTCCAIFPPGKRIHTLQSRIFQPRMRVGIDL